MTEGGSLRSRVTGQLSCTVLEPSGGGDPVAQAATSMGKSSTFCYETNGIGRVLKPSFVAHWAKQGRALTRSSVIATSHTSKS